MYLFPSQKLNKCTYPKNHQLAYLFSLHGILVPFTALDEFQLSFEEIFSWVGWVWWIGLVPLGERGG